MRPSLLLALVVVAACTQPNPNFCLGAPDNNCNNVDAAPMRCTGDTQCTGATGVCKLPEGVCVECVASTSCTTATEPICDQGTNQCVGCSAHTDCPGSSACLPDGSCAEAQQVAYVAALGTGTECSLAMPCGTLAAGLARMTPVVKLIGPGVIADANETLINRSVTIVADKEVQLDRTMLGSILRIEGTGIDVRIYDVQITGAVGNAVIMPNVGGNPKLRLERVAIHSNAGLGLVLDIGSVVIERAIFSGNSGGGADIRGDFEITNSMFVANGAAAVDIGGLSLNPTTTAYKFQFNTVANNSSQPNTEPKRGIACTEPMNLSSSILHNNKAAPECMFAYSLFDTGTQVSGTNVAGEPVFRNVNPLAPMDPTFYRIGTTSAAIDRGDPAGPMVDIDGDARPQGAARDVGADETK